MANGLILNVDTTKSEFQNPMVELRQGDGNYQSLHVTVTNNGDPVDLTGWTITFMGTTAGAHKIVDANAVVDNALQGTFNYTPTKAWGQDIGEFNKAYFKFVKSDETASGANFRVNVLEAVDLTDEEAGDYISVVDALIDKVKTDMDAKLADTQTTLTNTQNQANTVQTNVDDLNTNVNELKEQNNNLLTSDNTWDGSNKFSQPINGKFANKILSSGTDLYTVIEPGFNYISQNVATTSSLKNVPNGVSQAFGLMTYDLSGYNDNSWAGTKLVLTEYATGNTFFAILSRDDQNVITIQKTWQQFANESNVVHNTGNETISGDKTFTGANTFSGINNFNAAQNFNGGVIGLGYSSLLNTGNGLSVVPAGVRQTTDGGQSWHSLANDDSVVHLTGTETITGDKTFSGTNSFSGSNTFTGTTDLQNQKQYKASFTIGSNTINLTRISNTVYVTAVTTSQIAASTTAGTIPAGFVPISDSPIVGIIGAAISYFLFQPATKNVWVPVVVGSPSKFGGTYLTADPLPTS